MRKISQTQKMKITILVLLLVYFAFAKETQIWMCLERCGDSKELIQRQLDDIREHAKTGLTSISFELYNLGANGTLVKNDLAEVASTLAQIEGFGGKKLGLYPMISSYPYPKEFIDYMRYLFQNPDEFIATLVKTGVENGFSGYNVDWEPASGATSDDALAYAKFLGKLEAELIKHGLVVQVDMARWSPIWNYTAINEATKYSKFLTMDTYTGSEDRWKEVFLKDLQDLDNARFVPGLEITNPNTEKLLSQEEIDMRFGMFKKYNAQGVSLWRYWDPKDMKPWWQAYEDFLST